MKRVLLTLLGLALMFGQSSSPTGMAGAAATSSGNQLSAFGDYGSSVNFGSTSSKAEVQNIIAIGAVVAGVAAAGSN